MIDLTRSREYLRDTCCDQNEPCDSHSVQKARPQAHWRATSDKRPQQQPPNRRCGGIYAIVDPQFLPICLCWGNRRCIGFLVRDRLDIFLLLIGRNVGNLLRFDICRLQRLAMVCRFWHWGKTLVTDESHEAGKWNHTAKVLKYE